MKHTSLSKHVLEYPKLICFLLSCVLAYVLFRSGEVSTLTYELNGKGYWSAFAGGVLFSFGFTSAFGIAIFATIAQDVNPYLAGLVGGLGAFLSDFCIFQFVRFSLQDEIGQFKETRLFKYVYSLMHHQRISERMRLYFLWSVAGLVIASPLPDEFGITMISGISNIRKSGFMILCYCLNTAGILLILLAARALR